MDIDLEQWNDQLRTYLTAGMLTTKHAARAMIEGGVRGCIIHLISTAGHYGEAGNSGYSAAKAGCSCSRGRRRWTLRTRASASTP